MSVQLKDWTKSQFHAFILVCGAHSNYEVSPEEKLYITSVTGEDDFQFAEKIFKSCSDFECANIIKEGHELFYPSEHDKLQLESELRTLFAADHEYESLEENFLRYMDKLLK